MYFVVPFLAVRLNNGAMGDPLLNDYHKHFSFPAGHPFHEHFGFIIFFPAPEDPAPLHPMSNVVFSFGEITLVNFNNNQI